MTLVCTTYDRHGQTVKAFESLRPYPMDVWPLRLRQGGYLEFTHGDDRPAFVANGGEDQRIYN